MIKKCRKQGSWLYDLIEHWLWSSILLPLMCFFFLSLELNFLFLPFFWVCDGEPRIWYHESLLAYDIFREPFLKDLPPQPVLKIFHHLTFGREIQPPYCWANFKWFSNGSTIDITLLLDQLNNKYDPHNL